MNAQFASIPVLQAPALKQRRTLKGHNGKITAIAWSADSKSLVSAGQDGKLVVWDAQSTNKLQAVSMSSSWVMAAAMSPSGRVVAAGGLDNICSVYNLKDAEAAMAAQGRENKFGPVRPTKELTGHVGFISGIKFLSEGEMVTSSGDQTCALWDVQSGKETVIFKGHEAEVMGLALLRDASGQTPTFVSASGDNTVRLWDIRTGTCQRMFTTGAKKADLTAIEAFPDSNAFATGGEDAVCRLFDIRADREVQNYACPDAGLDGEEKKHVVTGVSFSSSGKGLFVSYDDEYVRLWDTLKGQQVTMIKAHDERVTCIAVAPDGTGLASASWDKILKIWV